jgi:glycosyltransferase involved in cell wall biosynthesis
MRIGLDARYTSRHFPGIGRYTVGLARGLAELSHGHTLVLIIGPETEAVRYDLHEITAMPGVDVARAYALPFAPGQQIELPQLARRLRLDLLHSPYYIKPYFGLPCPSVLTVYDLLGWRYPRTLSTRGRLLYNTLMGRAVRTADAIVTVSQHTRDDLVYRYKLPADQISVTPLAAERRFHPQPPDLIAAVRKRYDLPERYLLYLGANKPHKNLERLVRAWERVISAGAAPPDLVLVLAGHEDPAYPEARRFVAERNLAPRVRFLPDPADADLPALYSGALIFVFPSYYEGFGLPPLEAMACGVPVVCSYAASLSEVVGNAALTVDPFSSIEMAEELSRLLRNPALRRTLRERGLHRARSFTWSRTALETLRVYERVTGR